MVKVELKACLFASSPKCWEKLSWENVLIGAQQYVVKDEISSKFIKKNVNNPPFSSYLKLATRRRMSEHVWAWGIWKFTQKLY